MSSVTESAQAETAYCTSKKGAFSMTPPWRSICTVLVDATDLFSRPSCTVLWTTSFPLQYSTLHLSAEGTILLVCGQICLLTSQVASVSSTYYNRFSGCSIENFLFSEPLRGHPRGVHHMQRESKDCQGTQGRPTKLG